MAVRSVDRALTANMPAAISDLGDGPNGVPYPDARSLGPLMAGGMRMVRVAFTPGTTVDDAGDTIANTDDLDVVTGFTPMVAMLHCADTNEYQIVHFYNNTNGLKTLDGGATAQGAFFTFADGQATVLAAALTNAKAHILVLIG